MKITTTSRHYELTPVLKEYAESKIQHLTTFFDNIVNAHIIFTVEKYRQVVEVTLHVNGKDIVAHDESDDMYASVDRVAEKLERQVIKHKGKLYKKKSRRPPEIDSEVSLEESAEEEESDEYDENEVIPADPIEFPSLSLSEAILTLHENGRGFNIFSNRSTNRLNVIFKREDGTIGIIEA